MCDDEAIFMVEDSACALGQWYDGKTHAGLLGNIGCFSFSVPKLITTGQGGMVVTNDEALKVRCMEVIDQGSTSWRRTGIHEGVGANFKFNDICAAYGLAQLNDIEELLKKRYSIHTTYLEEGIPLHTFPQGRLTGPWTNILVSKKAQAIKFALLQEGIESRLVYRPLHLSFKRPGKVYKNSRYLAEYALYLPSSLSLTKKQVRHICSIIKSTGV
jgi:perosamine synthetase